MLCRLVSYFPSLSGGLAFNAFCMPRYSRYRSADHAELAGRARVYLRDAVVSRLSTSAGRVQIYVLAPEAEAKASVLLVHGWTGEASFMSAFGEYLRRRGFRSVLFDFPAHGQSRVRKTNLIACAHALREVAEALGPIDFVVAHSMGGLAALHVCEGGAPLPSAYPFRGFVLVSSANRFSDVTRDFGRECGLTGAAQRDFERRLERLAARKISQFSAEQFLSGIDCPVLLLHARDDAEVPFSCSEEIAAAYPRARLQAFDGLGHRNILYTPDVIRAAAKFLEALV